MITLLHHHTDGNVILKRTIASGGEAVKVSGWRRCSGGGVLLGSAEEGKEAWGGTISWLRAPI